MITRNLIRTTLLAIAAGLTAKNIPTGCSYKDLSGKRCIIGELLWQLDKDAFEFASSPKGINTDGEEVCNTTFIDQLTAKPTFPNSKFWNEFSPGLVNVQVMFDKHVSLCHRKAGHGKLAIKDLRSLMIEAIHKAFPEEV